MSPRLTPQQKAQCGLALIEEAIVALLEESPEGLTREEMDAALGLPADVNGKWRGIFGMTLCRSIEVLEKRKGRWCLRESAATQPLTSSERR